jgi:FemAB-related protein (PEP-CTERM system-associated)
MIVIREYTELDKNAWDSYVNKHPDSTLYHLSGWKNVIEKTYGHKTYYLMALRPERSTVQPAPCALHPESHSSKLKNFHHTTYHSQQATFNIQNTPAKLVGILPLVHLKHFLFGNSLISVPFLDYGGILADDQETELALLNEAIKLTKNIGAKSIELRQINPISCMKENSKKNPNFSLLNSINPISYSTKSSKVRMLIELPESSDKLMKSFKSKLRSQIRKPLKEGLTATIGGVELLEDFYKVFTTNMRDLGSPVHSKKLMQNVLYEFSDKARVVIIHKDKLPMACSVIIGFKDTLENPWASSLREFSRLAPNMLLYWTMLQYACNNNFKEFDFGRSTPMEGTYKFKKQWGAKPVSLHWHHISIDGHPFNIANTDKSKFAEAIKYWQKLPLIVTNNLGPLIRKHIGL